MAVGSQADVRYSSYIIKNKRLEMWHDDSPHHEAYINEIRLVLARRGVASNMA